MKKIITLLFLVFGLYSMIGQTTTSSIKGIVKGANSELLPGATIQAVHIPTGSKYSALSNEDGRFSMLNMKIGGPYKVTATFVGYQTQEINDVFLELGRTSALEFLLVSESQSLAEVKVTSKSKVFGSGRNWCRNNYWKKGIVYAAINFKICRRFYPIGTICKWRFIWR